MFTAIKCKIGNEKCVLSCSAQTQEREAHTVQILITYCEKTGNDRHSFAFDVIHDSTSAHEPYKF